MNEICTTLEQSKKLLELGIDPSTADMYYPYLLPRISERIEHIPNAMNPIKALECYNKGYTFRGKKPLSLEEYCVPSWSLSALMKLMPRVRHSFPELCRGKETGLFYMWLDEEFDTQKYSNPIDAAVEMVIWLKESKYI